MSSQRGVGGSSGIARDVLAVRKTGMCGIPARGALGIHTVPPVLRAQLRDLGIAQSARGVDVEVAEHLVDGLRICGLHRRVT